MCVHGVDTAHYDPRLAVVHFLSARNRREREPSVEIYSRRDFVKKFFRTDQCFFRDFVKKRIVSKQNLFVSKFLHLALVLVYFWQKGNVQRPILHHSEQCPLHSRQCEVEHCLCRSSTFP